MYSKAVDRDDGFAGAWVIEVGHEAIDGGNIIVSARGVDMGSGANDEGDNVAGARVVNVGHEAVDVDCEVVDEDNALTGFATSPSLSLVTSSLSAATSIFVSCPLGPPTSALSFEFPGSLVLLL